MKFRDTSLIIIVTVVGIAVIAGWVSSKIFGPDNPVEEIAETVIKDETGQDIDLSPQSPEHA